MDLWETNIVNGNKEEEISEKGCTKMIKLSKSTGKIMYMWQGWYIKG